MESCGFMMVNKFRGKSNDFLRNADLRAFSEKAICAVEASVMGLIVVSTIQQQRLLAWISSPCWSTRFTYFRHCCGVDCNRFSFPVPSSLQTSTEKGFIPIPSGVIIHFMCCYCTVISLILDQADVINSPTCTLRNTSVRLGIKRV